MAPRPRRHPDPGPLARAYRAALNLLGLPRLRRRVLVGGVALGVVFTSAVVVAGVVGLDVLPPWPDAPEAKERTSARTAVQPDLRDALLHDGDLSPDTPAAPAAPTAASGAPGTPPAIEGGPADDPAALPVGDRAESCRTLFERPGDVATAGQNGDVERASSDDTRTVGGGLLRQALAVFRPGGAERAFDRLRDTSSGCREFDATMEDGTSVQVRLAELARQRAGDESHAVRLTVTTPDGTLVGYLAVSRTGAAVTVLRHLGPPGSVRPGQAWFTLRRSVEKLRPIAEDRERRRGPRPDPGWPRPDRSDAEPTDGEPTDGDTGSGDAETPDDHDDAVRP